MATVYLPVSLVMDQATALARKKCAMEVIGEIAPGQKNLAKATNRLLRASLTIPLVMVIICVQIVRTVWRIKSVILIRFVSRVWVLNLRADTFIRFF